jgi:hypothetical protein
MTHEKAGTQALWTVQNPCQSWHPYILTQTSKSVAHSLHNPYLASKTLTKQCDQRILTDLTGTPRDRGRKGI